MKPITLITLAAGAWLLSGCAMSPHGPFDLPVSALVLDKSVTVPEGRARVFLQDGAVVNNINEFKPQCALEIRQVNGPPRTVPAGVYPVTRVQDVSTPIVLNGTGHRVAAVSFGVGIGVNTAGVSNDGDSPSDIFEGYHFWLADNAGVGLMRLTCLGARAQPVDVEPPTRAEIAKALGSIGRLEFSPGPVPGN